MVLQLVKTAQVDLAQQWANKINASLATTVDNVIQTGRFLLQAKKTMLVKRGWLRMFKDHRESVAAPLLIGRRTAHMYMTIAEHAIVANGKYTSHLPSGWYHLYLLTRLKPRVLMAALDAGRIHPDMTQRQISALMGTKKRATKVPVPVRIGIPRVPRPPLLVDLPEPLKQTLITTERTVLNLRYIAYRLVVAKYLRDLADSVYPYQPKDYEESPQ
jgi:hypothetical protein